MLHYTAFLSILQDPQINSALFLLNKLLLRFCQLLKTFHFIFKPYKWFKKEIYYLIATEHDHNQENQEQM